MQGDTLLSLREQQWSTSSGISRLDSVLAGSNGFKSGIYDLAGTIDAFSVAIYEILFNAMLPILTSNEEVLVINSLERIPWFKLTKKKGYKREFSQLIHEIEVTNLIDLIILFKNNEVLRKYKLIVINSFGNYHSTYVKNLKNMVSSSSELINKFNQSQHKLFHLMQKTCVSANSIILTVGTMKTFKQEMKVKAEEQESEDESGQSISKQPESRSVTQKILVPTISLNSDINVYYTNRIILYRDWVCDIDSQLISGLNSFEESINLLSDGKLRCLPHWKCTSSKPNADSPIWSTGFFLIDNNFQIIDIDKPKGMILDEAVTDVDSNCGSDESEIPDSQEW